MYGNVKVKWKLFSDFFIKIDILTIIQNVLQYVSVSTVGFNLFRQEGKLFALNVYIFRLARYCDKDIVHVLWQHAFLVFFMRKYNSCKA